MDFGDCDGDPSNGCEVNVDSGNPQYCGTCNNDCSDEDWPRVLEYGCSNSQCRIEDCEGDYGDCNGNRFDGCEVDLSDSTDHCGRCNNPCGAGQSCENGDCVGP
jgi:hypothetical protein